MIENINNAVSKRIRQLRRERGLSQEKLAMKANLSTNYIGAIERNLKQPTIDSINRICYGLDISLSEFFAFEEIPSSMHSHAEQEIIKALKDLPPKAATRIAYIVKEISELNK